MRPSYRVLWTRSAVEDLDEILEYLVSEAGVGVALTVYEALRTKIDTLSEMPSRCRRVPELLGIGSMEYRELIFRHYRVILRIDEAAVVLLGVLDDRRDLEELLIQRATLRGIRG